MCGHMGRLTLEETSLTQTLAYDSRERKAKHLMQRVEHSAFKNLRQDRNFNGEPKQGQ